MEGCRVLGPNPDPLSQIIRGVTRDLIFNQCSEESHSSSGVTNLCDEGNLPNFTASGVGTGARGIDHFKVPKVTDVLPLYTVYPDPPGRHLELPCIFWSKQVRGVLHFSMNFLIQGWS